MDGGAWQSVVPRAAQSWTWLKQLSSSSSNFRHTAKWFSCGCCSANKSSLTLWSLGLQQSRLPCPSLFPGVCSNSCPFSQWCYLSNSSSDTLFSFCLQSFPASESLPMSWLFISSAKSSRASASASIFLMNIQCWFPLGLIGLILLSKGLSRVFSNTTIWKYQLFSSQPSL